MAAISTPTRAECALAIYEGGGVVKEIAIGEPLKDDADWITLATFNLNKVVESVLKSIPLSNVSNMYTLLHDQVVENTHWTMNVHDWHVCPKDDKGNPIYTGVLAVVYEMEQNEGTTRTETMTRAALHDKILDRIVDKLVDRESEDPFGQEISVRLFESREVARKWVDDHVKIELPHEHERRSATFTPMHFKMRNPETVTSYHVMFGSQTISARWTARNVRDILLHEEYAPDTHPAYNMRSIMAAAVCDAIHLAFIYMLRKKHRAAYKDGKWTIRHTSVIDENLNKVWKEHMLVGQQGLTTTWEMRLMIDGLYDAIRSAPPTPDYRNRDANRGGNRGGALGAVHHTNPTIPAVRSAPRRGDGNNARPNQRGW